MINKTFNSYSTDGRALEVGRNGERTWLNIRELNLENTMFRLAPSDAPALALAILEAAGVAESSDEGVAAQYLRASIAEQERATAEAKERAELEAEALELHNSGLRANQLPIYDSLDQLGGTMRNHAIAVARRAREIGGRADK